MKLTTWLDKIQQSQKKVLEPPKNISRLKSWWSYFLGPGDIPIPCLLVCKHTQILRACLTRRPARGICTAADDWLAREVHIFPQEVALNLCRRPEAALRRYSSNLVERKNLCRVQRGETPNPLFPPHLKLANWRPQGPANRLLPKKEVKQKVQVVRGLIGEYNSGLGIQFRSVISIRGYGLDNSSLWYFATCLVCTGH